ncbi:hypothetical protein QR680_004139 [Steinernema hermaphroditum]|uniref:Uncharacterized protein n=1 Tax=Steinernema hermaphroditum TaxID=289476 RepID=A0AA39HMS2_9BILA|nr:hypothetical protein QR680_004139 [Steinernema hermaphroditum]
MATVAPLYEDDFCLVGDQNLTIKKYFFPSRKNVVLSVNDIRVVYFAPQDESKYSNIRTWGKTKNECYWAPDFRRCLPGNKHRRHNVVVDIEDGLRRGFTVENIDAFLDAIRSVCSFHIIIADNLNV